MVKRQQFLLSQIEDCLNIINNAPPGKLEIHKNNSSFRWYVKPDNGPRFYLPRSEFKTARLLADKKIAINRLSALEKELRATELYLRHYPKETELINLFDTESRLVELINVFDCLPWHLQDFSSNPSFPENLKHPSPSGHMLRSKSECLIDMELFYRNIPFRYECELNVLGHISYPDFTFYNEKSNEYKYWEHFGMIDDPKYRKRAFEKMDAYISQGFVPGKDVIFSFETSSAPLTVTTIDRIIDDISDWLMN